MNINFKNMKFWCLFNRDEKINLNLSASTISYKCAYCDENNIGALSFVRRNERVDFDLSNGTTQMNLHFDCVKCRKQNAITFLMGHKENITQIADFADLALALKNKNKVE